MVGGPTRSILRIHLRKFAVIDAEEKRPENLEDTDEEEGQLPAVFFLDGLEIRGQFPLKTADFSFLITSLRPE